MRDGRESRGFTLNGDVHIESESSRHVAKLKHREKVSGDLRESRALSPDAAVVADDGGGGEVMALAVHVTHEVVVDVSLP